MLLPVCFADMKTESGKEKQKIISAYMGFVNGCNDKSKSADFYIRA